MQRLLALAYLVLALPVVLRLAWVTPPFQSPDEAAHVFRAAQIGQGGLIGTRSAWGEPGGVTDAGLAAAAGLFEALHFQRHATETPAMACAVRDTVWSAGSRFQGFPNTVIYPPFFYAPEALLIAGARPLHLRVWPTLRVARMVNGILAVTLAAHAIAIAGTGLPLLAVLLSLPMTVGLFASCSQDALLIAVAGWTAAFLSRRAQDGARRAGGWALVSLGLGAMAAARPPYAAFLLLPVAIAWTRGRPWPGSWASAGAAVILLGWIALGTAGLVSPTRAGGGLLGGAQWRYASHHPGALPMAIGRTLVSRVGDFWRSFVGVLGWLDVVLPAPVYVAIEAVLVGSVVLAVPGAWSLWKRNRALSIAAAWAVAAGGLLVMVIQYLAWTTAGLGPIDGLQGRYFIPIAMMAAVLAGPARPTRPLLGVSIVVVVGLLAADLTVVANTVKRHTTIVRCAGR